jgi:hypothetical protein
MFSVIAAMQDRCEQYDWKHGLHAGSVRMMTSEARRKSQRDRTSCELINVT